MESPAFRSFIPKHILLIKLLLLVQHTMGNVMQFTEPVGISYIEVKINKIV